jgi:anti-anti-sigma factor
VSKAKREPLPSGADLEAGPRLTSQVADELRAAVRSAAGSGQRVVRLRLDQVTAFDSSGLGLLVRLHRVARSLDSRLVLVNPAPTLHAVLRRRGLHRVIAVELDLRVARHDAGHPDG